jgi:membrane associated rhomboid family serine protease
MNNSSFWHSIPPVVKNIIIINLVLFLGTIVVANYGINLRRILGLYYWTSDNFNAVQFVTYMFMHGSWTHIFFNMFAVFMLGSTLEHTWGSKRFFNFYMITGIGAGLIHLLVTFIRIQILQIGLSPEMIQEVYTNGASVLAGGMNYSDSAMGALNLLVNHFINMPTVGASGAVFGILLAFGMLFPNAPLYIMFIPVPIKAKYFVIGYGILSLYLGFANRMGDNIAHFAHLGGMLFGIILILYWKKKGRLYG